MLLRRVRANELFVGHWAPNNTHDTEKKCCACASLVEPKVTRVNFFACQKGTMHTLCGKYRPRCAISCLSPLTIFFVLGFIWEKPKTSPIVLGSLRWFLHLMSCKRCEITKKTADRAHHPLFLRVESAIGRRMFRCCRAIEGEWRVECRALSTGATPWRRVP